MDEDKEKIMTELVNGMFVEIERLKKKVAALEDGQKTLRTNSLRSKTIGAKLLPTIADLMGQYQQKKL